MMSHSTRRTIGLISLVVVLYSAVLYRNLNESARRSLELRQAPIGGDSVDISMRTISFDPITSEMTVRMSFRLDGRIAKDPVTPAVDLKLFLNGIRGPQEIEFPRGERMSPVEVVFPVDGNANKYPFDYYGSSIRLRVTRRFHTTVPAPPPMGKAGRKTRQAEEMAGGLLVTESQASEPLPMALSLIAAIPGMKFKGERAVRSVRGVEGFNLVVRRADGVVTVSILIMVLMLSLAMSVLLMSVEALATGKGNELIPLSLCVSLLFGLPALRNGQPAVPSLGVFGDYLSFLWAEQMVAVSAIILIWSWTIRQRRASPH